MNENKNMDNRITTTKFIDLGLSVRASNCCVSVGIKNKADLIRAIKTGRIHPNAIPRIRNFGWQTYREICRLLNMPFPKQRTSAPRVCPHCGLAS